MGWFVETLVTFNADEKEGVMKSAGDYLESLPLDQDGDKEVSTEADIILSLLSRGSGYTCGPKGGVWAIAFTGNYTRGKELAEELFPFFRKLWNEKALLEFYNATIVTQDEQTSSSRIFVIEKSGIKEHPGPNIWATWD